MPTTLPSYTPRQEKVGTFVIRWMARWNTWLYRATAGRLGGRFPGGAPVMLLTTIGRKSGQPRTAPLLYLCDGEDVVCVASKGGMSHHPLWFENLRANPAVEIEIRGERSLRTARVATPEEKGALWPRLVAMYGSYADYQARTERDIPVVILAPRA